MTNYIYPAGTGAHVSRHSSRARGVGSSTMLENWACHHAHFGTRMTHAGQESSRFQHRLRLVARAGEPPSLHGSAPAGRFPPAARIEELQLALDLRRPRRTAQRRHAPSSPRLRGACGRSRSMAAGRVRACVRRGLAGAAFNGETSGAPILSSPYLWQRRYFTYNYLCS
jgi:hypothetical protein